MMLFSCGTLAGVTEGIGVSIAVEVVAGVEVPQPASSTTPSPAAQVKARCLLLMSTPLPRRHVGLLSWATAGLRAGGDRHRLVERANGDEAGYTAVPKWAQCPRLSQ